jgi:quercetin dioxygenase-like cupin family protein
MRKQFARWLSLAILLGAILPGWAADAPHSVYTPEALKWGDPPPFVPKGSQIAVLYGDPAKAGLFIIQVKLPADYRIPAHSHPTDEVVTVLRGTLLFGKGDKLDPGAAKALPTGSVVVAPAKMNHYILTKERTRIQVVGMGPLTFNYVNPADNPSKK